MIRISRLLPSRLRTFLLALAEVGNDRNAELKLALIPKRRALFVDVGANRGQFARFMSSFYDRVIVFEPMEAFAEELNSILADNCTVYGFALADDAGPATFHVPESAGSIVTQTASLIEPSSSTGHNRVTVQVRRLDDFMLDDVSFIKVDIEGAEFQFLNGAIATMERCRPVLLIEIEDRHTGGNTRRVFNLLSGMGYAAFIQRERRGAHSASPVRHLLRGASYASRLRRMEFIPISHRLDEIYTDPRGLNRSIGEGYINNFLFVPRRTS